MAEPRVTGGPLAGIRVVELAGIGPAPFTAMMLADMGADVVRVDRTGPPAGDYAPNPVLERGRRSLAVDLKQPAGVEVVLRLVGTADALVEGFRPGVMERLGLGPADCLARRPSLVYGRMTGWGQDGPLAHTAGHDINYVGLTGALHAIGRAGQAPVPPLNLVGDFGGGSMFLAFGIVCALLEARTSGAGQVVDAAVVDGTAVLMSLVHGLQAVGRWRDERGSNLLDTGCPYYDVYACADGRYVAVGSIEFRFYRHLLAGLGLGEDLELLAAHRDPARWPRLRDALTAAFAAQSRDTWAVQFAGTDACVTPVLSLAEAPAHDHAVQRAAFTPVPESTATSQAAPAPRFSRHRPGQASPAPHVGQHTGEILAELGYAADEVDGLAATGAVTRG